MDKNILEDYINRNYSFNQIAKETEKAVNTIRYWCKKYELTSNFETIRNRQTTTYCIKCDKEFDKDGSNKSTRNLCIECNRERGTSNYHKNKTRYKVKLREQRYAVKQLAVDYKGGKCQVCGYDKCLRALQFHHLNREEKEIKIADYTSDKKELDDILKKELDKCICVCANCHNEIEEDLINQKFVK